MSIVLDLPDPEYRAWPGLSYSSAKTLMLRSPAKYRHEQEHGRPDKTDFDLGHVVHRLLLGAGAEVAIAFDENGDPYPTWNKKAAQDFAKTARAAGKTPLLQHQFDACQAAADAARKDPLAGPLLDLDGAHTEVSIRWTDPEHGVPLKARLDLLRELAGRVTVVDVKTCDDASVDACRKAIGEYRYHWQRASNVEALEALGVVDPAFLLVFVEKQPPHLVNVIDLDDATAARGRRWWRAAVARYAACTRAGAWPGYPPGPHLIGLNRWHDTDPDPVDPIIDTLGEPTP
jgi:hypothetical protein